MDEFYKQMLGGVGAPKPVTAAACALKTAVSIRGPEDHTEGDSSAEDDSSTEDEVSTKGAEDSLSGSAAEPELLLVPLIPLIQRINFVHYGI